MLPLLTFWGFIQKLLLTTLTQFVTIFGVFFLFGLILYLFARMTRTSFVNSVGVNADIYFTGWLGTPVHELGHALFCVPFGHTITEMKLFTPKSGDGSLGYVNHSYNPSNPWHQIGNFFIAFGPIMLGSFIIFLLVKYFLPANNVLMQVFSSQPADLTCWSGIKNAFFELYHTSKSTYGAMFTSIHIHQWQFWVFLYLCLCIASHMELSPADLKGLWIGILAIIIILLIFNAICIYFNLGLGRYVYGVGRWTNLSTGIFTFATTISAMNFVFSFIILNIVSLIVKRKLFHPIG